MNFCSAPGKFICAALLGFIFSVADVQANFKNLSFMGSYNKMHPTYFTVFKPFFDKAERDLDKEVTFDYYSSNMLYPESEGYAVLEDGRVDFGVLRPSVFPGKINLATVVNIPGMASNSITGSLLAADVRERFPEIYEDFPKTATPITVWASDAYQYHSIKPIRTYEEFKGQKVIVWDSEMFNVALKLGANPIRLMSTDTYLSLSKGMADGVICPIAPLRSFKISELAKYHFMMNLAVNEFDLFAYTPLFDELSPKVKNYIKKNTGRDMSLAIGKSLWFGAEKDKKILKRQGDVFYEMSEADDKIIKEKLAPFKSEWLKTMQAKGYKSAQKILEYAEERSAYYQVEFDKGVYTK